MILVAFYYLLRIGEYTSKGKRNDTKQTVQFEFEDVTFFKKNRLGQLHCLPHGADDLLVMTADGATLKLDNKKNRWKGVCVSIRKLTGIHIFVLYELLGGVSSIFDGMGASKTHFCPHTG